MEPDGRSEIEEGEAGDDVVGGGDRQPVDAVRASPAHLDADCRIGRELVGVRARFGLRIAVDRGRSRCVAECRQRAPELDRLDAGARNREVDLVCSTLRVRLLNGRAERAGAGSGSAKAVTGSSVVGISCRIHDERSVRRGDRERFGRSRRHPPRVGLDVGHVDAAVSIHVGGGRGGAAFLVPLAFDPGELDLRDVLLREPTVTRNVMETGLLGCRDSIRRRGLGRRPERARRADADDGGRFAARQL